MFFALLILTAVSCQPSKLNSYRKGAFSSEEFQIFKERYIAWRTDRDVRQENQMEALEKQEYKTHSALKLDNRLKNIKEEKILKSFSASFFELYPLEKLKLSPEEFMAILDSAI